MISFVLSTLTGVFHCEVWSRSSWAGR